MKSIQQRQAYIAHKLTQLDKLIDAHRYTRRLARIMFYHKLLSEVEVVAVCKILEGDEGMKTVDELVNELHVRCTTKNGIMSVYVDDLKSVENLFENVIDEIINIGMAIEHGDLNDYGFGLDLTPRAARGLITRLRNFLKRHSPEYYEISKKY